MPRKIKTSFTGSDEDRAISGIHDIAFLSRERDGVKGFEVRVGGGTSIMARVAPTLYEFVEADNGDYLKVAEAVFRIFDRQDWLRVNRARARIKVLVDKIGMDAFRELVDEELEGDWVERARIRPRAGRAPQLQRRRGGKRAGGAARAVLAERRPHRVRALPRRQRRAAAPGGLLHRRGQGHPRRPHPGAVPRPRPDHARVHRRLRPQHRAAELRPALGPRRGALRRLASGSAPSASARPAPARSPTSSAAPAPTAANSGSPPRWASTGRSRSGSTSMQISDELTKRIHIKMSGCPNGCSQHHIANIGFYGASLKVGGRQMPAYIPHIGGNFEGGEVDLRHAAEIAPAGETGPRGGRALDQALRVRPQRGRGVQRLRRAGRRRALRSGGQGADPAGRVQPRDDAAVHRLEPLQPLQGRARRGGVRDLARPRDEAASRHPLRHRAYTGRPRPRGDRRRARGAHRPGGAGVDVRELRRRSTTSPARSRKRAR